MISDILIAAIQAKQCVVLHYHGYTRTVEPHRYWQDDKRADKLLCWQRSGGSKSGEPEGWKQLNVAEVHSASTSETYFASARQSYKREDSAMRHIYAQL